MRSKNVERKFWDDDCRAKVQKVDTKKENARENEVVSDGLESPQIEGSSFLDGPEILWDHILNVFQRDQFFWIINFGDSIKWLDSFLNIFLNQELGGFLDIENDKKQQYGCRNQTEYNGNGSPVSDKHVSEADDNTSNSKTNL